MDVAKSPLEPHSRCAFEMLCVLRREPVASKKLSDFWVQSRGRQGHARAGEASCGDRAQCNSLLHCCVFGCWVSLPPPASEMRPKPCQIERIFPVFARSPKPSFCSPRSIGIRSTERTEFSLRCMSPYSTSNSRLPCENLGFL